MAEFLCKIGAPGGEILQKVYVAETEDALRAQMEEQGYYVFGIEKKFDIAASAKAIFAFSRKKVSDKQFMIFNQELRPWCTRVCRYYSALNCWWIGLTTPISPRCWRMCIGR